MIRKPRKPQSHTQVQYRGGKKTEKGENKGEEGERGELKSQISKDPSTKWKGKLNNWNSKKQPQGS